MQLKEYQRQCLSQLQEFAKAVVQHSDAGVAYYQQTRSAYQEVPQLPQLPYVCLRVPTGGGKTILGACAVGLLTTEYLRASHSLVLWLAPSDTIVQQTLQALRDRNHPYRLALEQGLQGAPLEVMDLSQALYLTRGALDGATTVLVSTIQALRVDDTSGRKVYENNGSLMSHFSGLPESVQENLEKDSAGNLAFSLANVLRLRRPLVIMDEAHNARTPLSFETLTRFAPSFVLELTATPSLVHAPSKGLFASNVLVSISALALKQANMIKMPIQIGRAHV